MDYKPLVYVGKIVELSPIPNADMIVSATVICGSGGKWRGVVKKDQLKEDDLCLVYLPDSLIPPNDEMKFMEKCNWRVKMCRFRGAPSEVLIMPNKDPMLCYIGVDITELMGVTKYHKPVPAHLNGVAKGFFPDFIPKTDELNYQSHPGLVDALCGLPWYMTLKCDGSSTTAYRYKGHFGLCSRNLELEKDENNGYWKIAQKYKVEEKLPDGIAIQWETCGPGIQSNPMGLAEIDGFMFSAYDINDKKYLNFIELCDLSDRIGFPMVRILEQGNSFHKIGLEKRAEGIYDNKHPREGIVIRSKENVLDYQPISFKVINLDYETP